MSSSARDRLSRHHPLRILQWNCHSLMNKIDPSYTLFQEFDVLALSETWLSPDSCLNISNFNVFRTDSLTRNSGGLLLAVHRIRLTAAGREQFTESLSDGLCVLNESLSNPALNAENRYEIFTRHLRSCLPRKAGRGSSQEPSRHHKKRTTLPAPWWNDSCQAAVDLRQEIRLSINSLCPPSALHRVYSSLGDFPPGYSCRMFDSPFTLGELLSVIRNAKIRSSPGLDQIDYNMISALPMEYLRILLDIYNELLEDGLFPASWHHSLVFLIPKSTPGKYRPISLTSCLLKVLEKLILTRLDWWVESSGILPPFQFGFRRGRSCSNNLGVLTTDVYGGFVSGRSTACLFLDVQGAFDNVVPNILVRDLVNLGLPPKICWFICQLVNYRNIQFVFNGEISPHFVSDKGVPQGSILSPLLFNLYVSGCKQYLSRDCRIVQFADDIALYTGSSDPGIALRSLEESVDGLSRFLFARGSSVSPSKSALMVFTKKRVNPLSFSIDLNGIAIGSVQSHKFLGIYLDPAHRGKIHALYLVNKCGKLSNILKSLRGVWWGADPRTMLCVFKALVRGSIEYGSIIFSLHNSGLVELLERTQRRALRHCMGLRQTTPTNVIYAESGISPIKHRFTFLTSKFIFRSFALRDNLLIEKLYDLQAALFNNNKYNLSNRFLLYRAFCLNKEYKRRIASFSKVPIHLFSYETLSFTPTSEVTPLLVVEGIRRAPFPQLTFQSSLPHLIDGRHLIFTDASKKEPGDCVGIGVFSPSLHIQKMFRADCSSSVFSGECMAIIHAMEYILENGVNKVTIFSYSRSVIDVISSGRINRDYNYLVLILKNKLRSASLQGIDIVLTWIPTHVGILGNKTANLLAGRAVREGASLWIPLHAIVELPNRILAMSFGPVRCSPHSVARSSLPSSEALEFLPPMTSLSF
ncbi:uncharacterized protein [Polyergus mexicanus]|uniref:uncharacterized protein n=1 Tax=Polyergus mexicanus TaxID=615972 RepID=UPI0038B4F2CB